MQQQIDLLNDAKSHFDHWRSTRTKRGKIPDYLWNKVKPLIGRYSLSAITETLSINTRQIREHLDLSGEVNFVEVSTDATRTKSNAHLQTAVTVNDNTCSIELHRSTGGMLKINNYPIESLHVIIAQFIG